MKKFAMQFLCDIEGCQTHVETPWQLGQNFKLPDGWCVAQFPQGSQSQELLFCPKHARRVKVLAEAEATGPVAA